MADFDVEVQAWVGQTKEDIETVFKIASQELFFAILTPVSQGGRMRVDTGFLRASFRVTLDTPVLRATANEGVSYTFDSGPIALTINGASIGQTIFGTFTANYARFREYGAKGQPPDAFVMTNAARWDEFVNEAVLQVRAG